MRHIDAVALEREPHIDSFILHRTNDLAECIVFLSQLLLIEN